MYYFYSADYDSGDPIGILRSWISQIIAKCPEAFEIADDAWQNKDGPTASRKDIIQLFSLLVEEISNCTFIVDGLDECVCPKDSQGLSCDNHRSNFIRTTKAILAKSTTRFLIVSRDEADIRSAVYVKTPRGAQIVLYEHQITQANIKGDLLLYCESTVKNKFRNKSQPQMDELSRWLMKGSNGMFLWIKLQGLNLEKRGKGKNNKQLERLLAETPGGLNRLYERNWNDIEQLEEPDRSRAHSILRWAAFATRPLTVHEITEALLVVDDDSYGDILVEELPDAIDDEYIDGQIVRLCSSLVEIRGPATTQTLGAMTVHLTHFSVKEYVVSKMIVLEPINMRSRSFREAILHNELAKICLRYLNFRSTWRDAENSEDLGTIRSFSRICYHSVASSYKRSWPELP